MAEPLKNQFGPDVAVRLAEDIARVYPAFDREAFLEMATAGFAELELLDRGRHIATALAAYMPEDRAEALDLLTRSMGPELEDPMGNGMAAFYYLPHSYFIATEGLDHFEPAMRANYELTKRFSSEFCIRPYLEHHTERTLDRLRQWTRDESEHVRRLVSEGTRPRLPWHGRLRAFMEDPAPVLELLELLKDDDSEYVRRSVANNLNDISKDHPDVVIDVCRRWWDDGDTVRRRLVKHALRTLIKKASPEALDVLGYGPSSPITLQSLVAEPGEAAIGGSVRVSAELVNPSDRPGEALVDFRVHFVKANGDTSPKVFKGAEISVSAGERCVVSKKVSLRQHTTRTHYPGTHQVEAIVNGQTTGSYTFEVQSE